MCLVQGLWILFLSTQICSAQADFPDDDDWVLGGNLPVPGDHQNAKNTNRADASMKPERQKSERQENHRVTHTNEGFVQGREMDSKEGLEALKREHRAINEAEDFHYLWDDLHQTVQDQNRAVKDEHTAVQDFKAANNKREEDKAESSLRKEEKAIDALATTKKEAQFKAKRRAEQAEEKREEQALTRKKEEQAQIAKRRQAEEAKAVQAEEQAKARWKQEQAERAEEKQAEQAKAERAEEKQAEQAKAERAEERAEARRKEEQAARAEQREAELAKAKRAEERAEARRRQEQAWERRSELAKAEQAERAVARRKEEQAQVVQSATHKPSSESETSKGHVRIQRKFLPKKFTQGSTFLDSRCLCVAAVIMTLSVFVLYRWKANLANRTIVGDDLKENLIDPSQEHDAFEENLIDPSKQHCADRDWSKTTTDSDKGDTPNTMATPSTPSTMATPSKPPNAEADDKADGSDSGSDKSPREHESCTDQPSSQPSSSNQAFSNLVATTEPEQTSSSNQTFSNPAASTTVNRPQLSLNLSKENLSKASERRESEVYHIGDQQGTECLDTHRDTHRSTASLCEVYDVHLTSFNEVRNVSKESNESLCDVYDVHIPAFNDEENASKELIGCNGEVLTSESRNASKADSVTSEERNASKELIGCNGEVLVKATSVKERKTGQGSANDKNTDEGEVKVSKIAQLMLRKEQELAAEGVNSRHVFHGQNNIFRGSNRSPRESTCTTPRNTDKSRAANEGRKEECGTAVVPLCGTAEEESSLEVADRVHRKSQELLKSVSEALLDEPVARPQRLVFSPPVKSNQSLKSAAAYSSARVREELAIRSRSPGDPKIKQKLFESPGGEASEDSNLVLESQMHQAMEKSQDLMQMLSDALKEDD